MESTHRGAWAVVQLDESGSSTVIDSQGDPDQPIFARSAMKGLQALPLLETGAAEAFGLSDAEIALACASHSAEPQHVRLVQQMLARGNLAEEHLGCGPTTAWDSGPAGPRRRVFHCCSGKHASMLLAAQHLGDAPANYLHTESCEQQAVFGAVADMTGAELFGAIDGCSAPTFLMPLSGLATGIARLCTPASLSPERAAACERITNAAVTNPEMIGGSRGRSDTDLMKATSGRIFAKLGAEGVFVVGEHRTGKALAINIDDGSPRGFHALCLEILHRHQMLSAAELVPLASWADRTIRNAEGTVTGRIV
ncbi:MAG: asparaginase [Acidimicrobiales bacterium]|nr:asparaginase [Acidimicrobiales bacterium]